MSDDAVIEAINDVARIVIAFNSNGGSRSDIVRRLHMVGVKPARIGALLSMATKDVTSAIHKAQKLERGGRKASARA